MEELLAKVKAAKAELFDGYTKLDEAGLTVLAIRIGVLPDPDPEVAGLRVAFDDLRAAFDENRLTAEEEHVREMMGDLREAIEEDPSLKVSIDRLFSELEALLDGEPEQPNEGPRYPAPDGAWINPENGYPVLLRTTKSGVCAAPGARFSFQAGARFRGEKAWALWDNYQRSVVALDRDGRDAV